MKILFVAKHASGDNDDEGAIAFALRALGHEVVEVHEMRRHRDRPIESIDADLCLFLKWPTVSEIAETAKRMPVVYWHFDMIRSVIGDPTLQARSEHRMQWCADVLPHVTLGFHTDGDWIAADKSGKLRWLMQGADERVAGFGRRYTATAVKSDGTAVDLPPILFTGMVNHGQKRREHVEHLRERWGERFAVMGDGGPKYRKHGRELADMFASVKVVVAPDGPSTDRYWSNRVYLTTGLGGFLLHPFCDGLDEQYGPNELMMYKDRAHLDELIERYLDQANELERQALMIEGHKATMRRHLYRRRVAELLRMVKEAT